MSEVENILAILESPICAIPLDVEPGYTETDDVEVETKSRNYEERDFEEMVCAALDNELYIYERQKRVANGVIDIFVYDKTPWIIEVKRAGTPFYLVQAIAQLKFYAMCFKRSQLFITVPGGIDPKYFPILEEFSISELRGSA